MDGVRIDKWLWAGRFFKTRMLAAKACEMGRVISNGTAAKASREVKLGDRLTVTNEAGTFGFEVLLLSEMRGSAAVAAEMFVESEASKAARAKAAEERKALGVMADSYSAGRPSKRDRRMIHSFRGQ